MAGKKSERERLIAAYTVTGARGKPLIRIPRDELKAFNARMPKGIYLLTDGKYQARVRGADKAEVSATFDTLAAAEQWRTHQLSLVQSGDWVNPQAGKATVGHFWRAYRHSKQNKKESYRADIDEKWTNYLKDRFQHTPVAKVTPSVVEAYVRDLAVREHKRQPQAVLDGLEQPRTLSHSVVRRTVLVLKGILEEAVTAGAVAKNPVDLDRLPRLYPAKSDHEPNPISLEQAAALLDECRPTYRDLTEVMIFTGLRIGEARELRAKDVLVAGEGPDGWDYGKYPVLQVRRQCTTLPVRDDDGAIVQGPDGKAVTQDFVSSPKSIVRDIDLAPNVARILKKTVKGKEPDDLLFHSRTGGRVSSRGFRAALLAAINRANITTVTGQRFTTHNLRDTFATFLLSDPTVPDKAVQEALGHADLSITRNRYRGTVEGDRERLRAALRRGAVRGARGRKTEENVS